MKRSFLLLLLLAILSTSASAQLGLQVGWNITKYKYSFNGDNQNRSSIYGINAGLLYRKSLGKHLAIQPSLLFSRKGSRNYDTPIGSYMDYYHNKLSYMQLTFPVMYILPIGGTNYSVDFGVGPHIATLLSAKYRARNLNGDDETETYDIGKDFKRMDAGLSLIVGSKLGRVLTYIQYDLGMADVDPTSAGKIRNRSFSLNFAILLGK